jgi:hypothetical protein
MIGDRVIGVVPADEVAEVARIRTKERGGVGV